MFINVGFICDHLSWSTNDCLLKTNIWSASWGVPIRFLSCCCCIYSFVITLFFYCSFMLMLLPIRGTIRDPQQRCWEIPPLDWRQIRRVHSTSMMVGTVERERERERFDLIWFVMSNQAMTLVYNDRYMDMIFILFYLFYYFYTKLSNSEINK